MKIDIRNLQHAVRLNKKKISECAVYALNAMGENALELSLVFVDDLYIRGLNRKYRGVDAATDVLAFELRDSKINDVILGDVVISAETAKREAADRGLSFQEEINRYVIHGILHLLGYDDENPRDMKRMKEKEEKLLEEACSGRI